MKNEEIECIQEVEIFLRSCSGHVLDICYSLFKILENYEHDASSGLKFFLSRYEDIDTDKSRPVGSIFKIAQVEILEQKFGDVINKFIDEKAESKVQTDLFYFSLWDEILNGSQFISEEEKAFAIYLALRNPRIPFFNLEDGLQMSDETYAQTFRENLESVQKIRYIVGTRFDQKTQQASLLLDVLDSISDQEVKAVVFTAIIKYAILFSSQLTSNPADEEDAD